MRQTPSHPETVIHLIGGTTLSSGLVAKRASTGAANPSGITFPFSGYAL